MCSKNAKLSFWARVNLNIFLLNKLTDFNAEMRGACIFFTEGMHPVRDALKAQHYVVIGELRERVQVETRSNTLRRARLTPPAHP
jgi:hypothetical protein